MDLMLMPDHEQWLFAIIFCGTFALVGAVFLCVAAVVSAGERKRKLRCIAYANAEVCAMERANGSALLTPVFRYSVNERTLERPARYSSVTSPYVEGQRVDLFYDPENPNLFFVEGEKSPLWILRLVFGLVGGVLLLVALAVFAGIALF